jgi:1,4-dihydroxy-2-naphthoyl-CoA hydrolase
MAFKYSRRIYLGDTDAAGVVYFARGMEICHEAYEESLASSQINLKQMLREGKIALPIVQAEINFFQPLFCGDQIEINLNTTQLNQSEFRVIYQITTGNLERVLVKAQTQHVCINPQLKARLDLPLVMLNWLQQNRV